MDRSSVLVLNFKLNGEDQEWREKKGALRIGKNRENASSRPGTALSRAHWPGVSVDTG